MSAVLKGERLFYLTKFKKGYINSLDSFYTSTYQEEQLMNDIGPLQAVIGYEFKNLKLLRHALTHASARDQEDFENENSKLSHLGSQVLPLVITDKLFEKVPDVEMGEATRLRIQLTHAELSYNISQKFNLVAYALFKQRAISDTRGRTQMLGNMALAIIGAIFLDGGYPAAKDYVSRHYLPEDPRIWKTLRKDFKSELQALIQKVFKGETPRYGEPKVSGPDHNATFTSDVFMNDRLLGTGTGKTRKEAEMAAARDALQKKLWEK
jgi:ribonuclease-3